MSSQTPRVATKIVRLTRNWLLRRESGEQLRYEGVNISARLTDQPKLPGGVSTKMSDNDYHTRDGRGLSEPPRVTFKQERYLLTSGGPQPAAPAAKPKVAARKREAPKHTRPGENYDYGEYIEYDARGCFHDHHDKKGPKAIH